MNEWIDHKLITGGKPDPLKWHKDGTDKKYQIILNVSDVYQVAMAKYCAEFNIIYNWLPLNEFSTDMGINSIYGAMEILNYAESYDKTVYVHCAAGVCRSILIKDCYYFIKYHKHRFARRARRGDGEVKLNFSNPVGEPERFSIYEPSKGNQLILQSLSGHLPPIKKMEDFLLSIQSKFKEFDNHGKLDTIKLKSL